MQSEQGNISSPSQPSPNTTEVACSQADRERVIALFPNLPVWAFQGPGGDKLVSRILRAIESRHKHRRTTPMGQADALLYQLSELNEELKNRLSSMENGGYCWEGSFVRGKDILISLRGGLAEQSSPNEASKLLRRQLGIARHQKFPSLSRDGTNAPGGAALQVPGTSTNPEVPAKDPSMNSGLSQDFARMEVSIHDGTSQVPK